MVWCAAFDSWRIGKCSCQKETSTYTHAHLMNSTHLCLVQWKNIWKLEFFVQVTHSFPMHIAVFVCIGRRSVSISQWCDHKSWELSVHFSFIYFYNKLVNSKLDICFNYWLVFKKCLRKFEEKKVEKAIISSTRVDNITFGTLWAIKIKCHVSRWNVTCLRRIKLL